MPQLLMIKQSQTISTANLCLLNHENHVKPYQVPHMKPWFFRGFCPIFPAVDLGPLVAPFKRLKGTGRRSCRASLATMT
jgi:hypothetical protein